MPASSSELLGIARDTAIAAGGLAARYRAEGVEIAASKSSPEDIVTVADRETELLIRSLLADARPDDGFLGEEGGAEAGTSGLTWVVDPIDGTVNYAYGMPRWAVSIAVVEGDPDPLTWTALAGAVVDPVLGEVCTASRGGGAFLADRGSGGRRLAVRETELSLALVATGFSYTAERRERQADVVRGLIGRIRDIRRSGVASLDLCDVASGRVNAYYERGLRPWDHAAAALVATEAGARVTGLGGRAAGEGFLLAAPPALAEELERVLARLVVRE